MASLHAGWAPPRDEFAPTRSVLWHRELCVRASVSVSVSVCERERVSVFVCVHVC